jgi:hypothetical protein
MGLVLKLIVCDDLSSRLESMRIPLSPKDMIDLRGFTNVVVEEGGEAPL